MYCPQCLAVIKGRFCGKCGIALVAGDPPGAAGNTIPVETLVNPSFARLGLCTCGAAPTKITIDGVCSACQKQRIGDCPTCTSGPREITDQGLCKGCGSPRMPKEGDHDEIRLGAEIASVCDRGIKHQINQDWHGIAKLTVGSDPVYVLCVCDGVSSSSASGPAARAAVNAAIERATFTLTRNMSGRDSIIEAARAAQKAVCSIQWTPQPQFSDRDDESPTCTFVMAVVRNGHVDLGWLGDSRIYWATLLGNGCLVKDHSWINQQVAQGRSPVTVLDEARQFRLTRAIVRSLGSSESVDVANLTPEMGEFELPKGGALVVCSDGLHVYLDDPKQMANRVLEVMTSPGSEALSIGRDLIEYAKKSGGADNISAAVYINN